MSLSLSQSQQGVCNVPDMTAVRPFEDYLVLLAREGWRGLPKERDSERQGLDLFNVTSGHRKIYVVWRLPPQISDTLEKKVTGRC